MVYLRNRRKTRDEIVVQALYYFDGWVKVYDAPDEEAAVSHMRVLRAKNPKITYRIQKKRVPLQVVQP